ncbi:hypothetical protein NDU88_000757 [Pleurodeles waltl]|uniref:Uncharacterized protein n=1 Tax=Pleurodeles waltl TaxID=8319 RepID=A0AAV7N8Y6_PLEWA|nr:hypothetical protein NDU88_000757 [Pleurodeles waltl]
MLAYIYQDFRNPAKIDLRLRPTSGHHLQSRQRRFTMKWAVKEAVGPVSWHCRCGPGTRVLALPECDRGPVSWHCRAPVSWHCRCVTGGRVLALPGTRVLALPVWDGHPCASSGALSDLRVGVSRVSFPGSPSQGASPVLFLDPDQVTGVPLSFSPQGVRGKHGSAQRSGASRFGSSLGTRLFYGLRSPRDGAVVTEDGVRPYPRWRSRHRRRGTSLSKMAQSSQKTGYVLIQDGTVLTEDGVRPFPRWRRLHCVSPLKQAAFICAPTSTQTGGFSIPDPVALDGIIHVGRQAATCELGQAYPTS